MKNKAIVGEFKSLKFLYLALEKHFSSLVSNQHLNGVYSTIFAIKPNRANKQERPDRYGLAFRHLRVKYAYDTPLVVRSEFCLLAETNNFDVHFEIKHWLWNLVNNYVAHTSKRRANFYFSESVLKLGHFPCFGIIDPMARIRYE